MRLFILLSLVLGLFTFVSPVRGVEEKQSGTFTGTVIEKGDSWLRIKPAEGESERFTARWIGGMPKDGGGFDKDMVRQIAKVPVGAKVKIKWVYEERNRVVEIQRVGE